MAIMQDPQVLWGFSSLLIVVLGFFIKSWMNRIKEDFGGVKDEIKTLVKKLDCKQDKSICSERYPKIKDDLDNFYRHKHALNCNKDETGGVVIP